MTTEREKATARRWRIGLSAGTLATTLLLSITHSAGPACLFRLMFHVPCPGCGLTRSLEDIWRADFVMSFRHHPFGLPIFLLCWAVLFGELCRLPALPEGLTHLLRRPVVLRGLTTLLLSLWVMRLWLAARHDPFFLW